MHGVATSMTWAQRMPLEFLSYHIEASYLGGADAAFVCDLTAHYISQASDATRSIPSEPQDERPA